MIEGELEVAGLDVSANGPAELASMVGLVAQEPEPGGEHDRPGGDRASLGAARGAARGPSPSGGGDRLALAIPDLLARTTDTLSGGELQRWPLAAALATRPSLVLLDEPTSQLDPVAGDELISLLRRLEEWGVASCSRTSPRTLLAAAGRVLAFDSGSLAFDGPPSDFLAWSLRADPALATPGPACSRALGYRPRRASGRRVELSARGVELSRTRRPLARVPGDAASPGSRHRPPPIERGRARGSGVRSVDRAGEGDERTEALRGWSSRSRRGARVAPDGAERRREAPSCVPRRARKTRSRAIETARGVALLPQRPGDLFTRERTGDELPGAAGGVALRRFGLEDLTDADPRDLSGGERRGSPGDRRRGTWSR